MMAKVMELIPFTIPLPIIPLPLAFHSCISSRRF